MKANRPLLIVLLAVVAMVVIGVIAFVAGGDDSDDGDGAATGGLVEDEAVDATVDGSALPPLQGSTDVAVGEPFPKLSGTGLDGQPLEIDPADGPMVVVFLAHWCPHCQRELPLLVDEIAAGVVPEGVRVVGVSTAIDSSLDNYPPSEWLAREGWEQPTLVDPNDAAAGAAGVSAFPFFVAVDGDGNVAERVSGELSAAEFEALLNRIA